MLTTVALYQIKIALRESAAREVQSIERRFGTPCPPNLTRYSMATSAFIDFETIALMRNKEESNEGIR